MYLVCYTGCFDLVLTCCSNVEMHLWQKNDLLVKVVLFSEKMNLITFENEIFFPKDCIEHELCHK